MIAEDMALSRAMAEAVTRNPDLELQTQALSIATFRFVPADLRSSVGDKDVEAAESPERGAPRRDSAGRRGVCLQRRGRGTLYSRARIVNFHNTRRCRGNSGDCGPPGRELDASMRPTLSV